MKTLGIIGGLGPMSSVYFYEMITENTRADCDQEHLDIYISSRASTPDRTAFIMGESSESPLPAMIDSAKKLASLGCEVLAIPCNTAHYFYEGLQKEVNRPILNIITETADYIKDCGIKKVGLMATDGTIKSGSYKKVLEKYGIELITPAPDSQREVMHIIYENIKKGEKPDMVLFYSVANELFKAGAEAIILGCTELSLVKKEALLPEKFIDSLQVLAKKCILACGGKTE